MKYFRACCNDSARAYKIIATFSLFYFIADVRTCAVNASVCFIIAAFILFYCTLNHSLIQLSSVHIGNVC